MLRVIVQIICIILLFWYANDIKQALSFIQDVHIKEAIIKTVWFGVIAVMMLANTDRREIK